MCMCKCRQKFDGNEGNNNCFETIYQISNIIRKTLLIRMFDKCVKKNIYLTVNVPFSEWTIITQEYQSRDKMF